MAAFTQDYPMQILPIFEISIKKVILSTLDWENLNKTSALNGKINYAILQFIKSMMNIFWKTIIYLLSSLPWKLLKSGTIQFSSMISTWDNILKPKAKQLCLLLVKLSLQKCNSTTESSMTSLDSKITSITRSLSTFLAI